MACKNCGSDWVTKLGDDCDSCPHCCKQQRCRARKEGRWTEPTKKKACEECGAEFTAVGLRGIATRVLCGSQQCRASRRKRSRMASAQRSLLGICNTTRVTRPRRYCRFSGCGNELTRRDQKSYCGKPCYFAAIDAGEQQFKGRVRDAWAGLVDWAYEWCVQCPDWMSCEACGKRVERQHSAQRACSGACLYRLGKPLHERCGDCNSELRADTRLVKRCESCKKKRRNAWRKISGKTPRKRCKRHGVPCDPSVKSTAVFERDRYICQLCYRRCLDKFTVVEDMPDPLSPTVDHIIAIALGIKGHTWDNVQCACWKCNVEKGVAARGQMRLVTA